MAYYDQAQLSRDGDFNLRIAAAAQIEVDLGAESAQDWAVRHQWELAAAPGFADAYASAVAANNPRPGQDPSVISDAMILSAIQAMPPDPESNPALSARVTALEAFRDELLALGEP